MITSEEELRIMQLAAISTASLQNTDSTVKYRIGKSNPYWTQAYGDVCAAINREMALRNERDELKRQNSALVEKLEAVLLFHSASPWTETKKTQWWNWTQTDEATTRNLCDAIRLTLGRLPSCFGDFVGRAPTELPPDMRLNDDQRVALQALAAQPEKP